MPRVLCNRTIYAFETPFGILKSGKDISIDKPWQEDVKVITPGKEWMQSIPFEEPYQSKRNKEISAKKLITNKQIIKH